MCAPLPTSPFYYLNKVTLTREMARSLKNGDWLSDDHIYLAHQLSSSHIMLTVYCVHYYARMTGSSGMAVQILYYPKPLLCIFYVRYPNCTSTSIGGEVTVYGSKYSGGDHQLALVYRTWITVETDGDVDPVIHVPPVQQQKGSTVCVLFVIAFAVHAEMM